MLKSDRCFLGNWKSSLLLLINDFNKQFSNQFLLIIRLSPQLCYRHTSEKIFRRTQTDQPRRLQMVLMAVDQISSALVANSASFLALGIRFHRVFISLFIPGQCIVWRARRFVLSISVGSGAVL